MKAVIASVMLASASGYASTEASPQESTNTNDKKPQTSSLEKDVKK